MSVTITIQGAQSQLGGATVGSLIKDIPIPPRPLVVQQMQEEMARPDPDLRTLANIVGQDIGLTVAVLKVVNSPFYGLSRSAESIEQAVGLIGLKQLGILVTALALRAMLKGDANMLGRFYDTSARRASAMAHVAKVTGLVDVALAQTFGLFCDVGIPMLMHRFSGYVDTLKQANADQTQSFTAIEQAAHRTDHGLVGALMAKTWGLPATVALAFRVHHDYEVFLDPNISTEVARLISMNILAEEAIQRYAQIHDNAEWSKGGDYVASTLSMQHDEVEEWIEELLDLFAHQLN